MRMAVNVHLFAGCRRRGIDYGRNVLILPFQAVLPSIAAGTSASPIECINRDVWLQVGEQWPPSSVVGGCRGRARSAVRSTCPLSDIGAVPRHCSGLDFYGGGHLSASLPLTSVVPDSRRPACIASVDLPTSSPGTSSVAPQKATPPSAQTLGGSAQL